MTATVLYLAGALLLVGGLIGGSIGLAYWLGGSRERERRAKEDGDAADRMAGPMPTKADRARAARRRLRERGLRDGG